MTEGCDGCREVITRSEGAVAQCRICRRWVPSVELERHLGIAHGMGMSDAYGPGGPWACGCHAHFPTFSELRAHVQGAHGTRVGAQ